LQNRPVLTPEIEISGCQKAKSAKETQKSVFSTLVFWEPDNLLSGGAGEKSRQAS
jgi:hypothetical protein